MASLTRWTWFWVNSGSWWWTGRPGMLQFIRSQRVGHDWVTDLIWSEWLVVLSTFLYTCWPFVYLLWTPTCTCPLHITRDLIPHSTSLFVERSSPPHLDSDIQCYTAFTYKYFPLCIWAPGSPCWTNLGLYKKILVTLLELWHGTQSYAHEEIPSSSCFDAGISRQANFPQESLLTLVLSACLGLSSSLLFGCSLIHSRLLFHEGGPLHIRLWYFIRGRFSLWISLLLIHALIQCSGFLLVPFSQLADISINILFSSFIFF